MFYGGVELRECEGKIREGVDLSSKMVTDHYAMKSEDTIDTLPSPKGNSLGTTAQTYHIDQCF